MLPRVISNSAIGNLPVSLNLRKVEIRAACVNGHRSRTFAHFCDPSSDHIIPVSFVVSRSETPQIESENLGRGALLCATFWVLFPPRSQWHTRDPNPVAKVTELVRTQQVTMPRTGVERECAHHFRACSRGSSFFFDVFVIRVIDRFELLKYGRSASTIFPALISLSPSLSRPIFSL